MDRSVEPHGGELRDLLVDADRAETLKAISRNLADITLADHHLCDYELLATGAFSPLQGFMTRDDYESVLDRMRLQDGTLWPVPICLDVDETLAGRLEAGQSAALRDPEGFLLAVLHVADIWPVDMEKERRAIYGGNGETHPGVQHLLKKTRDFYVGGRIEAISLPLHFDFRSLRKTPREVRTEYQKLGWQRVVCYPTSSVIHRCQYEATLEAMRRAKANLLLLPTVGVARREDFDYYTRVRCYKEVIRHYPPEAAVQSLLPKFVRFAGVREVVLRTILAKNYGCTHYLYYPERVEDDVVPGIEVQNGHPHSALGSTREVADACGRELGVDVLLFDEMVYLPFEDRHMFAGQVAAGTQTIRLDGAEIRRRIRSGRMVPGWASFPEVLDELRKGYPPPERQGFTIFLTGLSGAGKSTIAKVLFSKMLERGDRPVTLLDGDIVRQHLSRELSFSKEHRDINVRRIGFVASEITKNRGVAICAPIAPYAHTRSEIRAAIEAYGGFIEVHVATPLAECEKRDRKGMYAKARAGLIKGYTGIDDPYEVPEAPELRIDTTDLTPDEAAHEILLFLGQKGFI